MNMMSKLSKYFRDASVDLLKDPDVIDQLEHIVFRQYMHYTRFFHTLNHINYIIDRIESDLNYSASLNYEHHAKCKSLILAAFWHDYFYDVRQTDNEKRSADMFKSFYVQNDITSYAYDLIVDTAYRKLKDEYSQKFHKFDFGALVTGDFGEVLKAEIQILREYQYIEYPTYREGRLQFLKDFKNEKYMILTDSAMDMVHYYIQYIKSYRPKIGIYAGSFNPFHIGHFNILQKAEKIFDKVIVVFAQNESKKKERLLWRHDAIDNREIFQLPEESLLTDYIKSVEEYADATLIRGLRDGYDLNHETNQLRFLEDLYPELKTVNIVCDKEFGHISSSRLKAVSSLGVNIDRYLP